MKININKIKKNLSKFSTKAKISIYNQSIYIEEQEIILKYDCEITDAFNTEIPCLSTLKKLDGDIEIIKQNHFIQMKDQNIAIMKYANESNQPIVLNDFNVEFNLKAQPLKLGIERVKFAISKDKEQSRLCGVILSIKDQKLFLSGTNGHILAKFDTGINVDAQDIDIKIPNQLLITDEEDITIKVNNYHNHCQFILGDLMIQSKNCESLTLNRMEAVESFKLDAKHELKFNRLEMLENLKKILKFVKEDRYKKIALDIKKNKIDLGYATIACEATEEAKIGVNCNYLLDIIKSCKDDFTFNYSIPEKPIFLFSNNINFILMPLRI